MVTHGWQEWQPGSDLQWQEWQWRPGWGWQGQGWQGGGRDWHLDERSNTGSEFTAASAPAELAAWRPQPKMAKAPPPMLVPARAVPGVS